MRYKNYIENKRESIKSITERMDFENGSDAELLALIKELEEEFGRNPYIAMSRALLLSRQKRRTEAIAVLKENLTRYPFHYFSHYYLMILSMQMIDVDKAFHYYAYALRYRECKDDADELASYMAEFKEMLLKTENLYYKEHENELNEMLDRVSKEGDYSNFPFDENGKPLVRKKLFEGRTEDNYFLNLYKTHSDFPLRKDMEIHLLLRYEMLKGEFAGSEEEIESNAGDIIAVSPIDRDITLTAALEDGSVISSKDLDKRGFHYFKFQRAGKMKLRATAPFFISHLKPRLIPNKPKLVMYIFADGLSFKFLKENNFEQTMPNLYRFFSQGYIAENCYATAEWTQPSVMTMSTGKYVERHACANAYWNYAPEMYNTLIQEYFHEEGYLTARICNNWRCAPSFGYYKQTDRTVFSEMRERMYCEEVVMETIGHLETFKDFYNYLWVTIEDLHASCDSIDNNPLVSLYEDKVVSNGWKERKEISIFKDYNEDGKNHYLAEMRKIDFYLGILFDYISANFSDEEILVAFNSDHGQKFISPEPELFKAERTNVPFMLRGRGIKPFVSEEINSNVDIMPTLLHLCGIPLTEPVDGRLMYDFGGEKREFAYTEAIYKDQYYFAAINDKSHVFYFKSRSLTKPDGGLNIFDYTARLINKKTNQDETDIETEKTDYYKYIVYEHVKTWIYI